MNASLLATWITDGGVRAMWGASSHQFDEAYAVQPADPAATRLLIGRERFQQGASVTLGLGTAINPEIPSCFCDACDEDSDSLIEQTRRYVSIAIDGFTEFRRYPWRREMRLLLIAACAAGVLLVALGVAIFVWPRAKASADPEATALGRGILEGRRHIEVRDGDVGGPTPRNGPQVLRGPPSAQTVYA